MVDKVNPISLGLNYPVSFARETIKEIKSSNRDGSTTGISPRLLSVLISSLATPHRCLLHQVQIIVTFFGFFFFAFFAPSLWSDFSSLVSNRFFLSLVLYNRDVQFGQFMFSRWSSLNCLYKVRLFILVNLSFSFLMNTNFAFIICGFINHLKTNS